MENRWNDAESAAYAAPLAQRVYTSRLLGADPSLVLHGGGNTSVKHTAVDLMGRTHDVLYVKGSGSDLATIEEKHFSPVRMEPLLELATLETLSDPAMARELRRALMDPAAPDPSVEAILHALLPQRFVDHTHADAVVSLTNTPSGERWIREVYGDRVVVIPYVMPGFRLSRLCAEIFPRAAHAGTLGMILMNHGIFSFGETARESYDRMISLVGEAEDFLAARGAWNIPLDPAPLPVARRVGPSVAARRREISDAAGVPMLLALHDDDRTRAFARHPDIDRIAGQGPATPDHVIRTKRVPLLGGDVAAYTTDYHAYFEDNSVKVDADLTILDPAPRVVLDPEWGLATVGRSAKEAAIPRDIYARTVDIILRSEALEEWKALPPFDIFEVEYWDLEQAKLRKQGARPPLAGEVVLVTGAASGIGNACVAAFRAQGAAVVALDIAPGVETALVGPDVLGIACDVTDADAVGDAIERGVRRFGGIDMAVLNAGILLPSAPIASLDIDAWRRTQQVNVEGNVVLMRALHPFLTMAPRKGRVVVMASKNVPAPGPGMAAYSASKAALAQLARVAALEWAADGIRVNTLHPNAVFDTGIWTEEVLAKRAAAYGMTIEDYKTNNLLKVEVTSRTVAQLACTLCGPFFACTTGAQIPVDGGNDRVI